MDKVDYCPRMRLPMYCNEEVVDGEREYFWVWYIIITIQKRRDIVEQRWSDKMNEGYPTSQGGNEHRGGKRRRGREGRQQRSKL